MTRKPSSPNSRLGKASSVIHRQGSSSLKSSRNLNDVGTPDCVRGYLATSSSPVQRVDPDHLAKVAAIEPFTVPGSIFDEVT